MRKGIFGLIAVFGILFIGATFLKDNQGKPVLPYYPMQETQSVPGSVVKAYFATAGVQTWTVKGNDGIATIAKAIRVRKGATAGNIVVHLIDNPAGQFDSYYFDGDKKDGMIFDQIFETGTTVDLDSIYVLE